MRGFSDQLVEAARTIEAITGVPPAIPLRRKTRKERQEQVARVKRFLALSPELQEGALQYAENMKEAYLSRCIARKFTDRGCQKTIDRQ